MTTLTKKKVTITIDLEPASESPSVWGAQANRVNEVMQELKLQILDMLEIHGDKIHGADASFKVKHTSLRARANVRIHSSRDDAS